MAELESRTSVPELCFSSWQTEIGYSGNGIVNQTGGAVSFGAGLLLGYNNGSYGSNAVGTYSLSNNASLSTGTSAIFVGHTGIGTFNQYGGSVTTSSLFLGYASNSAGTYTLSNNASLQPRQRFRSHWI